jgi:hypothetical protein
MRRLNQMLIANPEEFAAIFAEAKGEAAHAPAMAPPLGAAAGAGSPSKSRGSSNSGVKRRSEECMPPE